MSHSLRATTVALLVATICALTGGGAAATTMILEPAGEFTMVSNGAVTYSGEGIEMTCHMTISGELERSIASIETEGGVLGHINTEAWSECTEGEFITGLRFPWPMRITRILGTLPNNFNGILYSIAVDAIAFRIFGVTCLYVGALGMLWGFAGSPPIGGLIRDLGIAYTRFSGGFPCPARLIRTGEFRMSSTQTASFR